MELSFQAILYIVAGVVLGWFLSFIRTRFEVAAHKKELREYKGHLDRQMKVTSEGTMALERELYDLKKVNENLRISIQTLSQKPGRSELKLLNIYDSTIRKMMLKAPGFSGAWEVSLQEAENAYLESEKGFKAIVRKVFGSSLIGNLKRNENENNLEVSDKKDTTKGN